MKVIKKGKPWSVEAMCTGAGNGDGGCGAKLAVEEGDLYITESHSRDETEQHVTFRCCDCLAETDVGKNKVPSAIQGRLSKKSPGQRQSERYGSND